MKGLEETRPANTENYLQLSSNNLSHLSPTLGTLHYELIQYIFSFLSLNDVCVTVPLVCRSWRALVDNEKNSIKKMLTAEDCQEELSNLENRFSESEVCSMLCQLAVKNSQFAQKTLLNVLEKVNLKTASVFYRIAQEGNHWAQYCMGRIYVAAKKEDSKYLQMAADRGNLHAEFFLSKLKCLNEPYEMWIKLLTGPANKGSPEAQFELARICGDYLKAQKLYLKSAEQGHSLAMFTLYRQGMLAWEERFAWLIKATKAERNYYYGSEMACFRVGRHYQRSKTCKKNFPENILQTLESFINEEILSLPDTLKKIFELGRLLENDTLDEKSKKWLNYFGFYGTDPNIFPFLIGLMYGLGVLLPKDEEQALHYFLEGLKQQDPVHLWRPQSLRTFHLKERKPNLSFLNEFVGLVGDNDNLIDILIKFIYEQANSGNPSYQYILGHFCLSQVRGLSGQEAFKWFEASADKNFSDANYVLIYLSVLKKDDDKVVKYFQKFTEGDSVLKEMLIKDFLEVLKEECPNKVSDTLLSQIKKL